MNPQNNPSRSKAKRALYIYLSGLGIILAITGVLQQAGWCVLGCCAGIAGLPVIVDFLLKRRYQRALEQFFGITHSTPIVNLALSTYQNIKKYDRTKPQAKENLRYFKTQNGKDVPLIGSKDYLVGYETARVAIQYAIKLTTTDSVIKVIGDEKEAEAKEGPIICLGSNTSNNISDKVFKNLKRNNFEVNFDHNKLRYSFNTQEHTHKGDNKLDYAVLVRFIINGRTYFVCAGINGEGTVATAHYLVKKWKCLPTQPFFWVLKCYKESPRVYDEGPILKLKLNSDKNKWVQG